jgi:dihydrofolate reductase
VIGRNGHLPWDLPEDWTYFLKQTRDGILIFGRRCYQEMHLLNGILPDREFIVLSRNPDWKPSDATKCSDLPTAIATAQRRNKPIWICGGEKVYAEALPLANQLYLTLIDAEFEGDTYFPDWKAYFPNLSSEHTGTHEGLHYRFQVYVR